MDIKLIKLKMSIMSLINMINLFINLLIYLLLILYMIKNKEIYLIRHGETDYNLSNMSQGAEFNSKLNKNGINQAKLTGKYLKNFRMKDKLFDLIISSPLNRAYNTANIIADEINFNNNVIKLDCLNEAKLGKISGKDKYENFYKKYIEMKNNIIKKIKDPIKFFNYDIDKYLKKNLDDKIETNKELKTRINEIIKYINECKYEKIIIVSHSKLLSYFINKIFNINYSPEYKLIDKGNCWISYITYKNGKYKMKSPINNLHLEIKYEN